MSFDSLPSSKFIIVFAFVLLWVLESLFPWAQGRAHRLRHAARNLTLGAINAIITTLLSAFLIVIVASWAEASHVGLLRLLNLPPLVATSLSGPRAAHAAAALRAGGMRARMVKDAEVQRGLGSALLMSVIATLEVSGWSLAACRRRLDGAADEATRAMAKKHGVSRGPLGLVTSPAVLALALRAAEVVAPLPLEPYLRYHFTKVGAQTRMMMKGFLETATAVGVNAPQLHALAAALPPHVAKA